jgi:hypothetical protein
MQYFRKKQLLTNDPLVFCLYRHYEPEQLTHSHADRCKVGTWVVDEVRKAVEIGYGLVDVLEFGNMM